jgi:hypothetical protein
MLLLQVAGDLLRAFAVTVPLQGYCMEQVLLLLLELVPCYSTAFAGAVQCYCQEQVLLLLIELVPYYSTVFAGALGL